MKPREYVNKLLSEAEVPPEILYEDEYLRGYADALSKMIWTVYRYGYTKGMRYVSRKVKP